MGAEGLGGGLLLYLAVIGASLGCAVMAYTKLIKLTSAPVAVAVATCRKVATMVFSYVLYPKPFTSAHAAASACVLAGVVLSSFKKRR